LESQRVKFLTKGYLRGWLNFNYKLKTSKLREELILRAVEEQEYEELLHVKTSMDAALIAGAANKTSNMLKSLDKTYNLLLGLKLPDLSTHSKMDPEVDPDAPMTKESIAKLKEILQAAKEVKK
jgi:hypothetical protein